MAHYTAWDAFFKFGYSPYSDETAEYTQKAIYGRKVIEGEDQNRLTYPFYSGLVHAPFTLMDYAAARALYMTLLQIALFIGVILTLNVVKWKPPIWLLAIILIWSLLYYPEARGVILGQFAIFGFVSLAACLYLLINNRDNLAGVILVLSTVKPTLVFLVVPFLLFWALMRRRWTFIISFGVVFGILFFGSFLILPTWMSEWLLRIFRYSEYTVGQSPIWLLTHVAVPWLGRAGELIIVALLVMGMLWSWWMAYRPGGENWFLWSLSITLVVSNIIVPRSATTNYVMMLIPILWVYAALDRTKPWGRSVLLVLMLVSFLGLWWLHYATVVGNQEQPIMFIPAPIVLGIVLLWGFRWLMDDVNVSQLVY